VAAICKVGARLKPWPEGAPSKKLVPRAKGWRPNHKLVAGQEVFYKAGQVGVLLLSKFPPFVLGRDHYTSTLGLIVVMKKEFREHDELNSASFDPERRSSS